MTALTGKAQKSKQIDQLRRMGIPFFINAAGHPIVAKVIIEGGKEAPQADQPWRPEVLGV